MGLPQPNLHLDPDAYLEWEKTQAEKHEYLDGQVVQIYAMVGPRDAQSRWHSMWRACSGNTCAAGRAGSTSVI